MTMDDQKKFSQGLMVLAEIYNRKLSSLLLQTYWNCLKKYSYDVFESTLWNFLKNPDYARGNFPSPADWIRAIEGDTESKSLSAWTELVMTIRQVGHYESVMFTDPLIHRVVSDMGGWIFLCQQPERELIFLQKEFERRYRSHYVVRKGSGAPPHYLAGKIEHQNKFNGFSENIPSVREVKKVLHPCYLNKEGK